MGRSILGEPPTGTPGNVARVIVSIEPVFTASSGWPGRSMNDWNEQVALASAVALRALGPSLLAVGHGAALDAPATGMDRAIESARRAFS